MFNIGIAPQGQVRAQTIKLYQEQFALIMFK